MKIKIPTSDRKQALFIIDAQPATLEGNAPSTLGIIRHIIAATHYPLYVVATYYAGPESMFYKQGQWLLSQDEAGSPDGAILKEIQSKKAKLLGITKSVRSAFKCPQYALLSEALKAENITEIHLVGYDINDCVLATAYDSIDLGFYTYVIEEGCNHYGDNQDLVGSAIKILRHQNMTNNSTLFNHRDIEV